MVPNNEFAIYVDLKDVSNILLGLSQIEGISLKLPTNALEKPDANKKHPVYSISFDQLAPVVISLSGATTVLLALATAIFQFKTAKAKASQSTEKSSSPIVIHIQNDVVQLTEFVSPKELAAYLEKKLG